MVATPWSCTMLEKAELCRRDKSQNRNSGVELKGGGDVALTSRSERQRPADAPAMWWRTWMARARTEG